MLTTQGRLDEAEPLPGGQPVLVNSHDFPQDSVDRAVLPHHDELARPPADQHEVIVNTIAATTIRTGLRVRAELDDSPYDQDAGAPDPFGQPSPGLAWLCHPALTGLPAAEWDALTAALMSLHGQQREVNLDKCRGHRPRLTAELRGATRASRRRQPARSWPA